MLDPLTSSSARPKDASTYPLLPRLTVASPCIASSLSSQWSKPSPTRTTTAAPLSLPRSEGRGSNASGSAAGGIMASTRGRSPATARARLARSPVVASMRRGSARAVRATENAARRTATAKRARDGPRALRSRRSRRSALANEDALRKQAVHVLLGIGDGADTAIHRDAGEPIGVEACDLLFAFEPLDHAHRGGVHGLVQVRVLGMRNVIFRRFLGRALHVLACRNVLGTEAMDAFLDVDDLRHAAVRDRGHQGRCPIGGQIALFGKEFDGLRLGLVP